MACSIAAGRIEQCKDSISGLKNIYFINYQIEKSDVTYDVTNTDLITAVTNVDTLYKYELKSSENTFEQTINSDRNTGTTFFTQTLNVKLKKQDIATSKNVKLLAYGRPIIIVQDRNNNYFMAGLTKGMDLVTSNITTGAAMGDLSGYSLEFQGMEPKPANFITNNLEGNIIDIVYG